MIDIVEIKPWKHIIRGTDKRRWWTVIKRKDATFWCNCPSFRYNTDKCKHIDIIKAILEE